MWATEFRVGKYLRALRAQQSTAEREGEHMSELYDVIATNIQTGAIRVMDRNKTKENAEAFIYFAVARRGVDIEFYKAVPAGSAEGKSVPEAAPPRSGSGRSGRESDTRQPSTPIGPRTPDNSMVICPACTSQFGAISVDHQHELKRLRKRVAWAWVIIANASGGDWSQQSEAWRKAATKWERSGDPYEGLKGEAPSIPAVTVDASERSEFGRELARQLRALAAKARTESAERLAFANDLDESADAAEKFYAHPV